MKRVRDMIRKPTPLLKQNHPRTGVTQRAQRNSQERGTILAKRILVRKHLDTWTGEHAQM